MEVRVKIGTTEAIVTVANADEAISFLEKLSLRLGAASDGPRVAPLVDVGGRLEETPSGTGPGDSVAVDEDSIRQALLLMRGKKSGQILQVIAKSENGCSDLTLKREVSGGTVGSELNLGAAFAHLSKSCKKFGVDKAAVFHKKSKRGPKGKMSYFYRITDVAARLIGEIPNFDEEPEWDDGLREERF